MSDVSETAPAPPPLQPPCDHLEDAFYLETHGEQLYCVLHPTAGRRLGSVLLAGPFSAARPRRYISWVRWARYLARHGFEVLRFDYRGMGESTGRFEDFGFADWIDDVRLATGHLRGRHPEDPLLLHGLEVGALFGRRLFDAGVGDALLCWLPPKNAHDFLYEQLKIRLVHDFSLDPKERKTRDQLLEEIDAGGRVEVEGYYWTRRLLEGAKELVLGSVGEAELTAPRPIRSTRLDKLGAHALGGLGPNPQPGPDPRQPMRLVNPDLSELFVLEATWVAGALARRSA